MLQNVGGRESVSEWRATGDKRRERIRFFATGVAVEVKFTLENYLKAALYAYPLLETVEEDYTEHIKNKALLSYRSDKTAEELAFYIAKEILVKNRLVWLKRLIAGVLDKLSEVERALLAIRYFGKKRKKKTALDKLSSKTQTLSSDSKYFRMQNRLGEKVGAMLKNAGFSNEIFQRDFATLETFARILRFLEEKKSAKIEGF